MYPASNWNNSAVSVVLPLELYAGETTVTLLVWDVSLRATPVENTSFKPLYARGVVESLATPLFLTLCALSLKFGSQIVAFPVAGPVNACASAAVAAQPKSTNDTRAAKWVSSPDSALTTYESLSNNKL